jgi:cytochrome P450
VGHLARALSGGRCLFERNDLTEMGTIDMTQAIPQTTNVPPERLKRWDPGEDPEAATCPYRAAAKLHEGPDVFFNLVADIRNRGRPGSWVVTRYDLQREVLQNAEIFSSKGIAGFSALLGESWPLVPLELDHPDHAQYRALLNPLFSPARVAELEAGVREAAVELIEKVRAKGECEFMEDFGRPFPVGIFMRLMGLPLEEMPRFLDWEEGLLRGSTLEARVSAAANIKQYLTDLIADRRGKPTSDLVSFAVTARIDDRPLSDDAVMGICYLLFVGGLDTVAATLGFTFRELAFTPELQRELRADSGIIPDAVEEFVRAFGVVTTSRFLTRDHEFHGVTLREGDRVVIPLGLASRDDRVYENPHAIDFRRRNNRNISFSAGPHRCLGSHLARREFKIALEEWMARVPEFRVKDGEKTAVHTTGVWGVDHLPLVW